MNGKTKISKKTTKMVKFGYMQNTEKRAYEKNLLKFVKKINVKIRR